MGQTETLEIFTNYIATRHYSLQESNVGPLVSKSNTAVHSIMFLLFALKLLLLTTHKADLWRRASSRGHSGVTLRSSPTTR